MIQQDKIIEWAREAGFSVHEESRQHQPNCIFVGISSAHEQLVRFANLVAQHQKEQDARICVEIEKHLGIASECAAAIRSQE